MKNPPTYSTIPEAIAWLECATGQVWTDGELLDAAATRRITLHAGPPITAQVELCEINFGIGASEQPFLTKLRHLGWRMAILYPIHVAQILHAGETETVHAVGGATSPAERYYFSEPVRVTREQVRISREALMDLAADTASPSRLPELPTEKSTPDHDADLAALFDSVGVETLEAMFPDGKKWKGYAERARRNGLKDAAKVGTAKFNPYRAARWWMDTQAPPGWKWERCARVLANNLPARSRDSKHLLTGDFD